MLDILDSLWLDLCHSDTFRQGLVRAVWRIMMELGESLPGTSCDVLAWRDGESEPDIEDNFKAPWLWWAKLEAKLSFQDFDGDRLEVLYKDKYHPIVPIGAVNL